MRTVRVVVTTNSLAAALVLLGRCGDEPAWREPFEPAVCGLTPYAWLPPAKMGTVVTYEEVALYSLSRDAIATLLNATEYQGASHTDGAAWSLPEQFAWVADRLAGVPLAHPCERGGPACCAGAPADVCAAAP